MTKTNRPYRLLFDPDREDGSLEFEIPSRRGDARAVEEVQYVHSEETIVAVNVALSTGRPLLIKGDPGTGKSTLAVDVARKLGWDYHEYVVTSRTQAKDLLWEYDALERLNDATAGKVKEPAAYVKRSVLWKAFATPGAESRRAVVLIDEIDKADPDVPNDLLVALGSMKFEVAETGVTIEGKKLPLVLLTSNEERDLPAAFVRRCILLRLKSHGRSELKAICRVHYPDFEDERMNPILDRVEALRRQAEAAKLRGPSTAEFLDAVFACRELDLRPEADASDAPDAYRDPAANPWSAVLYLTLWKHDEAQG